MTITLSTDDESRLRAAAARRGEDPVTIAALALQVGLTALSADVDPQAVSAIEAGLNDIEAGRTIAYEDWIAEESARRQARRAGRRAAGTAV